MSRIICLKYANDAANFVGFAQIWLQYLLAYEKILQEEVLRYTIAISTGDFEVINCLEFSVESTQSILGFQIIS